MMAHFYVEAYYQCDTIQEVMSRHGAAPLSVCLLSVQRNVNARQARPAPSHVPST